MSIRGIAVLGYGEVNKEDEIATAFFKRFAMTLLLEIATFHFANAKCTERNDKDIIAMT